jgi:K+-sensing histidine kinase KdpD
MLLDGDYGELTAEQKQITSSLQTVFCFFGTSSVPLATIHRLSRIGEKILQTSHAERMQYPHPVTGTLFTHTDTFVCDNLLLTLSLQTLLTNALQYATPEAMITLDVTKTADEYIFSVQHAGKPFSEDEKTQLFLPHFRGEDAKKNIPAGSGIGLYLVKSLVE